MSQTFPDLDQFDRIEPAATAIGVVSEAVELLDPGASEIFRGTLSRLEDAGFLLREVSLEEFGLFRTVHHIIGSVEASSSTGKYDSVRYGHRAGSAKNWNDMYLKSRAESFGLMVKTYLFQGAYFQFKDYEAFENACRIRSRLLRLTGLLFEDVDYLVLPTGKGAKSGSKAGTVDDLYDCCSLTLPANVTGQPALSLPAGLLGAKGGPGLQFFAKHLDDRRLLSLADHLFKCGKGDTP